MRRPDVIVIVFLLLACLACPPPSNGDARTELANKAVVRDYLERLVNRGDWSAWPDLIAGATLTFNGQVMSREDMKQMRDSFFGILPDMRVEVVEQIAEGDVVASRIRVTGTHLGDYMGLSASGQEVAFGGIAYDRIVDGKVVEVWHEMNLWGTLLMVSDD